MFIGLNRITNNSDKALVCNVVLDISLSEAVKLLVIRFDLSITISCLPYITGAVTE